MHQHPPYKQFPLWRWMWVACLLAHKFLHYRIFWFFWNWWYSYAYGPQGMYALVYLAKQAGFPWAQPFGEGEAGIRQYLGWKVKS